MPFRPTNGPETFITFIHDLDSVWKEHARSNGIPIDDDTYTKISADSSNSYFTIYMNGLEPERYYQILLKVVLNGETIILDDNYYFKIIN
jgi:hypothetical protein